MPRHDWRDDETMSRERGEMAYGRNRGYRDFEDRDGGAFLGGDRGELRARRRRMGHPRAKRRRDREERDM